MASIDINFIINMIGWYPGLSTCKAALNSDLSGAFSESMLLDDLCPVYVNAIQPCLVDELLPFVAQQTGSCCIPFQDDLIYAFGKNLKDLVDDLGTLVGDLLCSVKTTKIDGVATQRSCGYQLLSLFVDNPDFIDPLLMLLQVPNDQVCLAVQNEPFITTMSQAASFGDPGMGYGICYETMDALFSAIAEFRWFAATNFTSSYSGEDVPLSNLFTDGKCIVGSDLVSWALSNDSLPLLALQMLDVAASIFNSNSSNNSSNGTGSWSWTGLNAGVDGQSGSMDLATIVVDTLTPFTSAFSSFCLRLPNHVTCDFSSETLALPTGKSLITPSPSTATPTSTSTPTPSSTSVTPTPTTPTPTNAKPTPTTTVAPAPSTTTATPPATTKKSTATVNAFGLLHMGVLILLFALIS